jgi:hypothetical protein
MKSKQLHMKMIFSLFFLSAFLNAFAQVKNYPGQNTKHSFEVIKKDSSGVYFKYREIDSIYMFLSNDLLTYRMYDKQNHLLVEGDWSGPRDENFKKKYGIWKEYYTNGKLKSSGAYDADNAFGPWKYYYDNGKIKSEVSYKVVKSDEWNYEKSIEEGDYHEFYDNGQLKTNGRYTAKPSADTLIVTRDEPPYDEEKLIIKTMKSAPTGLWKYFSENGILEKEIRFD